MARIRLEGDYKNADIDIWTSQTKKRGHTFSPVRELRLTLKLLEPALLTDVQLPDSSFEGILVCDISFVKKEASPDG